MSTGRPDPYYRPQAPVGVWLIAGTSGALYPCRCASHGYRECGKSTPWGCPCYGRKNADLMPDLCCARRYIAPSAAPLTY